MNMHDTLHAQPPTEHRTDYPKPMDIEQARDHDYDLIEQFLAGAHPYIPTVDEHAADPFKDVDPDVVKEYDRHLDELRAMRENKMLRDMGYDPIYEL